MESFPPGELERNTVGEARWEVGAAAHGSACALPGPVSWCLSYLELLQLCARCFRHFMPGISKICVFICCSVQITCWAVLATVSLGTGKMLHGCLIEAIFLLRRFFLCTRKKKCRFFFFYIFFPVLIFAKEHQLEVKYFPVLTGALIL